MKCRGVSPRNFAEKTLAEISDLYFSPRKILFRARGVLRRNAKRSFFLGLICRSNFGEIDVAPAKNWKMTVNKVEKWQKLTAGFNANHKHIFKPWKKDVKSCIKIGMKLELRSQGTHCLYTFIESEFTKVKKWQKLNQGLYPNHMLISRPWRKHVQRLKKIGIKFYEDLRSQGTHCLFIFIESEGRNDKVHKVEKVIKNKARIISKPHAHLQTMGKTCAKF